MITAKESKETLNSKGIILKSKNEKVKNGKKKKVLLNLSKIFMKQDY